MHEILAQGPLSPDVLLFFIEQLVNLGVLESIDEIHMMKRHNTIQIFVHSG